jgi:hypothetical protein
MSQVNPPGSRPSRQWMLAVPRLLFPLLVLLTIAWPDFSHFRIHPAPLDNAQVSAHLQTPDRAKLLEVAAMAMAIPLGIEPADRPLAAQEMLRNRLVAPAFSASPINLTGWPNDLQQKGLTFQLSVASLAPEALLLDEYEKSNNSDYYVAARDRILAFSAWEKNQRQPIAFLWNDHAVAARVSVLIRLWSHLRSDPTTSVEQRMLLLELINRSGELLAKDVQFTVRTNHGVMQNLALLQIGAAFPALAKVPQWRALAIQRLELQLGFYVSSEGVVLEHSAGYHLLGTELLAYAVRLIRLNQAQPSERLLAAADGAAAFSRQLLRPDGSIPAFGNTSALAPNWLVVAPQGGTVPVTRQLAPFDLPEAGSRLYPLAGYAVWWSRESVPAQTIVAWSKHDRHGHKHADEPSLHFWSRGYDWITAAGYWPYDLAGLAQANGWPGSNAPHAVGEKADSLRTVRLLAHGSDASVRMVDVENQRQDGLRIRRQVIQLSSDMLLVLDDVEGADKPVETLWTVDPRLELTDARPQQFMSSATPAGDTLHISLARPGQGSVPTQILKGSTSPFAGWVVVGSKPTSAPTLRVEQTGPAGLTATVISISQSRAPATVTIAASSKADQWNVEVQGPQGSTTMARSGSTLSIDSPGKHQAIVLTTPEPQSVERDALRSAMNRAMDLYPPWRELGKYRSRIYMAVPMLWLAAEVVIAFLPFRRRWRHTATVALLLGWIGIGFWLNFIYLV